MVLVLLPPFVSPRKPSLDLVGAALLSGGVFSLLVGLLSPAQRPGAAWAWLLGALVLGALFVRWEQNHAEPLIPLSLFAIDVQRAVNAAGFLMGVSLLGLIGFMPLAMRTLFGATPMWAGLSLLPVSLTWTSASLAAGYTLARFGFRTLVRFGGICVGLGLTGLWWGLANQSVVLMVSGMAVYGAGMGCCISVFTVVAQETCPRDQRGIATALTQFFRNTGGTVGMALLGALMAAGLTPEVAALLDSVGLTDPKTNRVLGQALYNVFGAMAATGLLAGVVALLFFPDVSDRVEQPARR